MQVEFNFTSSSPSNPQSCKKYFFVNREILDTDLAEKKHKFEIVQNEIVTKLHESKIWYNFVKKTLVRLGKIGYIWLQFGGKQNRFGKESEKRRVP